MPITVTGLRTARTATRLLFTLPSRPSDEAMVLMSAISCARHQLLRRVGDWIVIPDPPTASLAGRIAGILGGEVREVRVQAGLAQAGSESPAPAPAPTTPTHAISARTPAAAADERATARASTSPGFDRPALEEVERAVEAPGRRCRSRARRRAGPRSRLRRRRRSRAAAISRAWRGRHRIARGAGQEHRRGRRTDVGDG